MNWQVDSGHLGGICEFPMGQMAAVLESSGPIQDLQTQEQGEVKR